MAVKWRVCLRTWSVSCGIFLSLLIGCGTNRTVENFSIEFYCIPISAPPPSVYKVQLSIRGVGSVFATNVPFICGLACACLAEVYFSLRWVWRRFWTQMAWMAKIWPSFILDVTTLVTLRVWIMSRRFAWIIACAPTPFRGITGSGSSPLFCFRILNETNVACETTDYQVSADRSDTVLRVWAHHWGCQVHRLASNGMHSLQLESGATIGEVKGYNSTKQTQPLVALEGQNFVSDMTCLLLVQLAWRFREYMPPDIQSSGWVQ